MDSVDILIVGGGIAGLSTACHLAKAGAGKVLLLDREAVPGFYASGHNAGIARQMTGRIEHSRLAKEGRDRLAEAGLLQATGGLLLAAEAGALGALESEARALGIEATLHPGAGLPGLRAAEHLAIPSDGVIDTHGLLGLCANQAREGGVKLRYACDLEAVVPLEHGFEVQTSEGLLRTRVLVNAAGAWAGELGRRAGGLDLELKPMRRHLVWSDQPMDATAPWAWWVDRPLYLRPESGGVLLCPCDEDEVPLPRPGVQPEMDPEAVASLGPSVEALAPQLGDLPLIRAWSGLRSFAPDRRFVIGWDPVNPDLFWVAGLGGHGMTTGLAVGRLAAELLLQGGSHALSPSRFAF